MIASSQSLESKISQRRIYQNCEKEYRQLKNSLQNAFAEAQCDPIKSENWDNTYIQYTQQINSLMDRMIKIGYKQLIDSDECENNRLLDDDICWPLTLNQLAPMPAVTH